MCNHYSFVEVVVRLDYGGDTWEGVGYFPEPADAEDWNRETAAALVGVRKGCEKLFHAPWRCKLTVTVRTVSFPAKTGVRLLGACVQSPPGSADWLAWAPVRTGARWGVTEHGEN